MARSRASGRRSGVPHRTGGHPADFSLFRLVPIFFLPGAVVAFQAVQGEVKLPLVLVAFALGLAIAAQVRSAVITCFTTITAAGLLLSAAVFQELQPKPLDHAEAALPPAPPRRGPAAADASVLAGAPSAAAGAAAAPAESASTTMETMSVVLPCAFEGRYAARTVAALRQNTRKERLKEIIVVDDGSHPPLSQELPELMLRGSGPPVRLIRHEKTLGLIAAKKSGGDAATGDVIVFFDCHVKPRMGWEEAFLKQMKRAGDHRTVVVPTITSLNPDTWEESRSASSAKACYMTWNADFTWLGNSGRDVPLMSGGLLALSRRWWQETEGYDPHMVAWGGENIDQSLRAWLCGGRIELAEGAYVAHMWRDANNPKTALKYPMKTEDVMRNKARAVLAWLDEFKEKTLTFPEYEDFVSGKESVGDMSNFDRVRKRLKCAPFSAYIQRFSYVYVDTGLIPDEVFQLREESTSLCLERSPGEAGTPGVILAPCSGEGSRASGGVPELQLWHRANPDGSGGPCCSGLLNWNFLQCLNAFFVEGNVKTSECDISGGSNNQAFSVDDPHHPEQLVWNRGKGCVVPRPSSHKSPTQEAEAALRTCSIKAVPTGDASSSFRLRHERDGTCVVAERVRGEHDVAPEGNWMLRLTECAQSADQVFDSVAMLGGLEVRAGTSTFCLDAASGSSPLVYPCYDASQGNANQVWHLRSEALVWEGHKSFCLHARPGSSALTFKEVPSFSRLVLKTCVPKRGQRFRRHLQTEDGTFALRDEDTGQCVGAEAGHLVFGGCHGQQRWRELLGRDQLQHVSSKLCVDAGDEVSPIVYPCHEPRAQRKQRFRITDAGLQLRGSWEDNGRKRFFEKCLDHSPEPPTEVHVVRCDAPSKPGVRWTKINSRVPLERQLWNKVPPAPPGSVPLGEKVLPP